MTAPDQADLRLVATLAELGRASVVDLAAHARMAPEDVALRLLRLGGSGMRLVLGVECDQPALRAWVAAQPPAPAPASWGPPPTAGWVRPGPVSAAPAAVLGTRQGASGPQGEPLWVTPLEVVDTADALVAAGGHTLAEGTRAAVVHTEVTAGPAGYPGAPDAGLVLVLGDGREVSRSAATLTSRPPYSGGVTGGATVSGHTVFELDDRATITGLRWRAVPGGPALDWRL